MTTDSSRKGNKTRDKDAMAWRMYKKWSLQGIWKSTREPRINFENYTIQPWSSGIAINGVITVILSGLYFDHRVYEKSSFMWL